MVDVSSARVSKVIVHRIGNKIRDEGYLLSDDVIKRTDTLDDLVTRNYLAPVLRNGNAYEFHHESDIALNEVRHFSNLIFTKEKTFVENSKKIAKHLYSASTHPNIGGGEFIVVLFDDIRTETGIEQALGLFRIEGKDDFLDVEEKNGSLNLIERVGISLQRIQKGAVILSGNAKIYAIDSIGQKTKYWFDTFLKAVPSETPLVCAKAVGAFIKAVSNKVATPSDALAFGQHIQQFISDDTNTSIGQIKKISSNYLAPADVAGILTGIRDKVGVDITDDFYANPTQLAKYARDAIKKSRIANGINIVISNQDAHVSAVDIKKTKTGIRATIEIQIAES